MNKKENNGRIERHYTTENKRVIIHSKNRRLVSPRLNKLELIGFHCHHPRKLADSWNAEAHVLFLPTVRRKREGGCFEVRDDAKQVNNRSSFCYVFSTRSTLISYYRFSPYLCWIPFQSLFHIRATSSDYSFVEATSIWIETQDVRSRRIVSLWKSVDAHR